MMSKAGIFVKITLLITRLQGRLGLTLGQYMANKISLPCLRVKTAGGVAEHGICRVIVGYEVVKL